jgi:outer membrane receptor protein involved in Fe transport
MKKGTDKMASNLRLRLMTSTFAIGAAAFAAAPAYAQPEDDTTEPGVTAQPTEEDVDNQEGETITVTGSRIQRRDLTSTSPLAVVQDEEFRLSGATNVEQVLNTLPQVIPGSTGFDNNPGGGVATLQLRGLGPERTLVLVNGRRYLYYDVAQIVDLNTIPQFLIESVDVVTGGASAVYGSDALAGVVNFRLRNDLQGVELGAHYGLTDRGDGRRYGANIAIGASLDDNRGNVVAFAEYYNRGSIFADKRTFSTFSFNQASGIDVCVNPSTIDPVYGFGTSTGGIIQSGANAGGCATAGSIPGFSRAGSSTTETARINYAGGGALGGANFNAPNIFGDRIFTPGNASRTRVGTDQFNFAPDNYLMVPQERWLMGSYGEYEVSENVTAFVELTFVNNRVLNELAPSPVTGFFNINVAQACTFISPADCARFQQQDANETAANAADNDPTTPGVQTLPNDPGVVQSFVQRRILETGSRIQLDERNAFRILGGVRGEIAENLNYEAYYFYSRTRNSQNQSGNISRSAFQAGLDGTGTPINIFGPGSLTPEQVAAISVPTSNSDISVLEVASASINGVLGNLGLGADDIGFAVGVEYRDVSSQYIPDFALGSGDIIGFNAGAATGGDYNVKEVFGELRIPLLQDQPFFHRLELNGAARYSDYSLEAVGGATTYAGGVEWAPVRDITFRGQYQRAIRAPNVDELFGGQSVGFPPATDPCAQAAAATDAARRAVCIATGVPAASVGNSGLQLNAQIEGLFGGNPALEEETAETWTAGVVIRPSFIPRLNITLDGYDIEIEGVVDELGGGLANTLDLCYNVIQDASSIYCQAVNRNPAGIISGDEFVVTVLNANIGRLTTRGVDLSVDYSLPLGGFGLFGAESQLNFFFLGTYVDEFNITPLADLPDQINECAGRFGTLACAEPTPEFKWSTRLTYVDGPFTLTGRWRHVGEVTDDDDSTFYTVEELDAVDYFDLAIAFDVSDEFTLNMGINNLLDKQPQIIGTNQQQSNTYPNTYDVLGRDFFISGNFRF